MIEFNTTTPLYDDVGDISNVNLEMLDDCMLGLVTEPVLRPASAFTLNIKAIYHLLEMPHIMSAFSQGYAANQALGFAEDFLADKSLFGEDLRTEWESKHQEGEVGPLNLLSELLSDEKDKFGIRTALENQLAFVVAALWTALETLAKDVWVGAVNSFPKPLAGYALGAQGEGTGEREARSIKANWLTKYDFDLSGRMGTLLAEDEAKFKFSSPDQIIRAYKGTFKRSEQLDQMWASVRKDLNLLNLTRNLIAHRAGIVEERFNRQAKLNLPVGERLPLNTQNVHQFVNLAVRAGCELMTSCETYLYALSE